MRACRRRTTLFWCYVNGLQSHFPVYPQDYLHWIWPYLRVVVQTHFWKGKKIDIFHEIQSQIFQPSFSSKVQYIMKNAKGNITDPPNSKTATFLWKLLFPCGPRPLYQKAKTTLGRILETLQKWLLKVRWPYHILWWFCHFEEKRLDVSCCFNYSEFPLTSNFPLIKSSTN